MVALRSKIHEFWAIASRRIHLQVDIGITEPGINTRLYGFVQKWGIPQNCNFDWKMTEGSLEVKLPTIWTHEKQSRAEAEAERRERVEGRRSEEKESEERRCR